jgi:hypothetical protein
MRRIVVRCGDICDRRRDSTPKRCFPTDFIECCGRQHRGGWRQTILPNESGLGGAPAKVRDMLCPSRLLRIENLRRRPLAVDNRRHPVRRVPRRSRLDCFAAKVVNHGRRRKVPTIAQAVHINDRACSRGRLGDGRYEDTATATDKKIAGSGAEAVVLYQRPIISHHLE